MSTRRSLAGWLLVLMFGLMVPVLFVGCDGLFIDIIPGTTTQPADNDDDGFYVTVETVGNGKVLVDPKRTGCTKK